MNQEMPFFAHRRIAFVALALGALSILFTFVLEIQSREDLRATVLAKSNLRRVEVSQMISRIMSQKEIDKTRLAEQISDNVAPLEAVSAEIKTLAKFDDAIGMLIEGGTDDNNLLGSLQAQLEPELEQNGPNSQKESLDSTPSQQNTPLFDWLMKNDLGYLAILSLLFTFYSSPFLETKPLNHWLRKREGADNQKLFRDPEFYHSLLARIVVAICFAFAVLSIWKVLSTSAYFSSNALLGFAMICAGVLGVMSHIAILAVQLQARESGDNGTDTHNDQFDPKRHLLNPNSAGILLVTIGAILGLVTFVLVKSGKHIFLTQLDPVDVSLNPFSSVFISYLLAHFSAKYFKYLDQLASNALRSTNGTT